ncbi:MAG: hypothetical protein F6K62_21760 [Sphaerospermopsis sp. SIO1G2]|nr:hypothetical protein [Sphaerospermopsis sp. SIO1G1]NET73465.1 hypothetical protein [Sphaerospermopsis sp. SIO1G2]
MSKTVVLQNLGLAIATNNYSPKLLSYDFLKYSDIVPGDWELAKQPVMSDQISQIAFRNSVTLTAQPNLISFVEVISAKELTDVQAPLVAHNYVKSLPNAEYQAVGIDIRGYITATDMGADTSAQDYLRSLLAPAPWQQVGTEPVKASVQLAFTLENKTLSLNINEGTLYVSEEETVPIVLFNGNFSYQAQGNTKEERLESIHQLLDNWQGDLDTYQEIINTKFLTSEVVLQDAPQTPDNEVLVSQA